MVARAVSLTLACAVIAGCGGNSGSEDKRVSPEVKGSGEKALLSDITFQTAVKQIGVDPRTRPPEALGRAIGRRMRAVVTDAGRIDPESFLPPYRQALERRGMISQGRFERRYGDTPRELADRVGSLTGLLDVKLDEGADPAPTIARGALAGFGRRARDEAAKPAADAVALRDRINGLFPEGDKLQCASEFRRAYTFVVGVYAIH